MLAAENYFVLNVSAWDIDWRSLLAVFTVFVVVSLIPRPPWLIWCLTSALAGFGCWTMMSAILMRHKIVNSVEICLFCFAPLVIVFVWRLRHGRGFRKVGDEGPLRPEKGKFRNDMKFPKTRLCRTYVRRAGV